MISKAEQDDIKAKSSWSSACHSMFLSIIYEKCNHFFLNGTGLTLDFFNVAPSALAQRNSTGATFEL
jgi:hypothetical protein